MHRLAQHTGLVDGDRSVRASVEGGICRITNRITCWGSRYNVLCGGTCLRDIEQRRQDEVYLDALGAQRIPDPTTAGDFCRRFDEPAIEALQAAINETRVRVWRAQPAAFFDEAVIDAEGTLAETTDECKEGMDIACNGVWGYHPLVVSLAKYARAVVPRESERESPVGGRRSGALRSGADAVSRRGIPPDHIPGGYRFHADRVSGSLGGGRRALRIWLRRRRESDRAGRRVAPRGVDPVGASPPVRGSRPTPRQRPVNVKAATIVGAASRICAWTRRPSRSFRITHGVCAPVPHGSGKAPDVN